MTDWNVPRKIETMPESIDALDQLIAYGEQNQSPFGYFAALYRKVGWKIEGALEKGKFEHPEQLRKLDIVFFNRYLEALYLWRNGETPTDPWKVAFDATRNRRAIVLQHLLMAMNAHIDLDLGVATADAVPREDLPAFKRDFNTMNALLASLMHDVERDMALIFKLLKPINRCFQREEDAILNFSMAAVRERSWRTCLRISKLEGDARSEAVTHLARDVGRLSRLILDPGVLGDLAVGWIRRHETGDVARKIEDLCE